MIRESSETIMSEVMVSVIITTYKRSDSLERAIKSVDEQTIDNVEIIVVDDNDADTIYRKDTEALILGLQTKKSLVYIKHEKNMNGAAARNTGLSVARGKYIAFLDDDDYYYSEKMEKQVELMEAVSNEYGGAYSGFDIYRGGKKKDIVFSVKSGNYLLETLACTFQIGSGSNLFIKRVIAEELKGFDTSFRRHQDYEFLVRFFEGYKLAAVDEPLFAVEQKNTQSNRQSIDYFIATKQQYLKKYKYLIKTFQSKKQNRIYRSHKWQLMKMCIRQKRIGELLKIIFMRF